MYIYTHTHKHIHTHTHTLSLVETTSFHTTTSHHPKKLQFSTANASKTLIVDTKSESARARERKGERARGRESERARELEGERAREQESQRE